MKNSIISQKSFDFALQMVEVYRYLVAEKKEFVLSRQLLRSGTAIGALTREAEHAESRADFLHEMSIALKEANETAYWLLLLDRSNYFGPAQESVLFNCEEIIRMLVSTVKTLKKSLGKA
jgi:four helix bundle protein